MTGVGPLPKLTLLEAESESSVQLQMMICLWICPFCNEVTYERLNKRKEKYELLQKLQTSIFFCGLNGSRVGWSSKMTCQQARMQLEAVKCSGRCK